MSEADNRPVTIREFDKSWEDFRRDQSREREDAAAKVILAKESVDKELKHLNELREQYTRMLTSLPSRNDVESIAARVTMIEKWQSNLTGRFWALGAGLVIVGAIIGYIVRR